MSDIRTLSRLRDETRRQEAELADTRRRRDALCAYLVNRGWDTKWVGAAAGLAPSYVERLAKLSARAETDKALQV